MQLLSHACRAATLAVVLALAGCVSGAPTATLTGTATATPSDSSTVDQDDGVTVGNAGPLPGPAISTDPSTSAAGRLPGEPDPALTPGALNPAVSQATIATTICVSGWTATIRPPSSYTTALKIQQIGLYRYTDTSTADYEEDHLISLELGGAPTDAANLWPEPYTATLPDGRNVGARVKDQLETSLKRDVCAGTVTLAAAQAAIGIHWVHTYYGISLATGGTTTSTTPSATAGSSPTPTLNPAPASSLSLTFTSLTSPVSPGSFATAKVKTAAGAYCSIVVEYKSGASTASGLGARYASSSGVASWTWKVGTRTTAGSWPVTVTCSKGGLGKTTAKYLKVL